MIISKRQDDISMYNDAFSKLHPITFFGYFILLTAAGAFTLHPVIVALSFCGAVCFSVKLSGVRVLRKSVFLIIPALIAVAVNALFNHRGVTVLAELPSGNSLTLEAVLYGCASAGIVCSLMTWLYCFCRLYSSDKLLCLTGKIFPSLTIVISMTIRFIPLFVLRFGEIKDAQVQLGHSISRGSIRQRFRSLARIFSVLMTRSLEASVATADSMKSRGYGLSGRTSGDLFRFCVKDTVFCLIMTVLGGIIITGEIMCFNDYRYYPSFWLDSLDIKGIIVFLCFAGLCLLPTVYDVLEERKWRSSVSEL